jgi:hypothetical protein
MKRGSERHTAIVLNPPQTQIDRRTSTKQLTKQTQSHTPREKRESGWMTEEPTLSPFVSAQLVRQSEQSLTNIFLSSQKMHTSWNSRWVG